MLSCVAMTELRKRVIGTLQPGTPTVCPLHQECQDVLAAQPTPSHLCGIKLFFERTLGKK